MRRTPLVLLVTLVLVSGCEEQEAVPLSKSVPIAGLQALALLAPVIGGFTWEVSAYGAGPTVAATSGVANRPILLYGFAVFLLVDLVAIVWRMSRRRKARAEDEAEGGDEPETWEEIQAGWDTEGTEVEPADPAPGPLVGVPS